MKNVFVIGWQKGTRKTAMHIELKSTKLECVCKKISVEMFTDMFTLCNPEQHEAMGLMGNVVLNSHTLRELADILVGDISVLVYLYVSHCVTKNAEMPFAHHSPDGTYKRIFSHVRGIALWMAMPVCRWSITLVQLLDGLQTFIHGSQNVS